MTKELYILENHIDKLSNSAPEERGIILLYSPEGESALYSINTIKIAPNGDCLPNTDIDKQILKYLATHDNTVYAAYKNTPEAINGQRFFLEAIALNEASQGLINLFASIQEKEINFFSILGNRYSKRPHTQPSDKEIFQHQKRILEMKQDLDNILRN